MKLHCIFFDQCDFAKECWRISRLGWMMGNAAKVKEWLNLILIMWRDIIRVELLSLCGVYGRTVMLLSGIKRDLRPTLWWLLL